MDRAAFGLLKRVEHIAVDWPVGSFQGGDQVSRVLGVRSPCTVRTTEI